MAQSLSKVYIHIVFTTKYGRNMVKEENRKGLQAYMVGTLFNIGCITSEIYANPDHVHILCSLPRTITMADLVSKVKTSSSKWMKQQGVHDFEWQCGYGVFSVSASAVDIVTRYIQNQASHHAKVFYKDEFRTCFNESGIEFDERYVWD